MKALNTINVTPQKELTKIIPKDMGESYINMSRRQQSSQIQLIPVTKLDENDDQELQTNYLTQVKQQAKKIVCSICLKKKKNKKFYRIGKCDHFFCYTCIQQHIKNKIQNFQEINCCEQGCKLSIYIPLNQKYNEETIQIIEKDNSKFIFDVLSPKMKQQAQQLTNIFQELRQRKCKGCLIGNLIKKNQNEQAKLYCENCKVYTCIKCLDVEHQGKKCSKRALSLKIKLPYNFKQCPQCLNIIQKSQGCKHMKCHCGHQFCFECGVKWYAGHNCFQQPTQREGAALVLCIFLKLSLFPIFLGFLICIFASITILLCFASGIILGPLICCFLLDQWKKLISYDSKTCLATICNIVGVIMIILVLMPILTILLFFPGFLIPVVNICWRKKITIDENSLAQLNHQFAGILYRYVYIY